MACLGARGGVVKGDSCRIEEAGPEAVALLVVVDHVPSRLQMNQVRHQETTLGRAACEHAHSAGSMSG